MIRSDVGFRDIATPIPVVAGMSQRAKGGLRAADYIDGRCIDQTIKQTKTVTSAFSRRNVRLPAALKIKNSLD